MMKKYISIPLLLLALLFSSKANAQTHYADKNYYLIDSVDLSKLSKGDVTYIDSCLKLYHIAKADTTRIAILCHLATDVGDNRTWFSYAKLGYAEVMSDLKKENIQPAVKKRLYFLTGSIYKLLGYYYIDVALIDSTGEKDDTLAISYYKKAGSTLNIAKTMMDLGAAYETEGNIQEAMKYYQDALRILQNANDVYNIAFAYQYIGNLLRNQNDFSGALVNLKKSLLLFNKLGKKDQEANALNIIGICYKNLNMTDSAMYLYKQAFSIYDSLHDDYGRAKELLNEGVVYQDGGELDTALKYYQESLKIFEASGDKNAIAWALNSIAVIYIKKKDYPEAAKVAERNMKLSKEIGYPENIMNAAQELSSIYEGIGNYKEALEMHKLYSDMSDSILNANTKRSSIEQDIKYQHQEELMKIKQQQEKAALAAQKEREKRNIIIAFISGVLILVIGFLVFLYSRFRLIRKQKNIIEKQKAEVERKNMLIEEQKKLVEKQKNIVEEKNKDILDSIAYAKRLQDAILPPVNIIKEHLPESFILFRPKDIVAGDFYWMKTSANVILIAAADCTGHGVPGAMVSVVCSNALDRAVREFGMTSTGEILDKTRELVIETFEKSEGDIQDGMDISLCAINRNTKEILWSGANNPLWYIRNDTINEVLPDKQPIGKYYNTKPFNTHNLQLQKGDVLYIFSDGYADQFGGEKGKKFKYKPLQEKLLNIVSLDMHAQKEELEKTFENWKGELEQVDDVLIIGIRL